MENETQKLTASQRTRYDRNRGKYMAEGGATELLNNYDPEVLATWADDFAHAQSSAEREGIWAAVQLGIRKDQAAAGGKSDAQIKKDFSDQEVKRITDEMDEKERKERKRTEVERSVEEFIKDMSELQKTKKLEGASHPKDAMGKNAHGKPERIIKEVLRSKKDWSEIGWGEAETKAVQDKLKEKFKDHHALTASQMKNTIELLIATGRTADQTLIDIDQIPVDVASFEPTSPEEVRGAGGSLEKARAIRKQNWFAHLNIEERYIQRFILQEEFDSENESDYQHTDPSNIEEIAWQVMHHYGHKTWGPNGTFPLLEMRIGYKYKKDKNGQPILDSKGNPVLDLKDGKKQVEPKKSKYYLNQANFVTWARERMWNLWDINNDVGDFVSSIDLPKTYGKMDFGRMFPEYTKYFASEDGETQYWLMAQELIVESFGMGTMNQMASKYKEVMHDPDKLTETIGQLFRGNAFTKETFRKNLFELMMIMPLNYEGQKPGELLENDGIFGASIIEMFLAYYNLSDFDELQKILGKGSTFFTKEGYMWALQTVAEEKVGESSGESKPTVLNLETQGWLDKAFDPNGQISTVENKEYFIKLINFFQIKTDNQDAEYTVRRLLYRNIMEKYGRPLKKIKEDDNGNTLYDDNGNEIWEDAYTKVHIGWRKDGTEITKMMRDYGLSHDVEGKKNDEWSLKMSWVTANAMARVYGAAMRNDSKGAGFDGMNKMHWEEIYRDKMINKNGVGAGNPLTMHQFKMLAMDPMNAIVTESFKELRDENGNIKYKKDEHGEFVRDKNGKKVPILQAKTWMEVMKEVQKKMTALTAEEKRLEGEYEGETDDEKKEAKREKLEKYKHEKNRKYLNKAGELAFRARAESNYYDDHLMRAHQMYKTILDEVQEVNLDNFVDYDAWGGVRFNRAKFQKNVQRELMHPIRYFVNTYADINYNQKFRMIDQAATIRARKDNPDALVIFREMPLGEAMFGHELLNREKFWKKDSKNRPICMKDDKGRDIKGVYEIDYDKVNSNKDLLWKQWFMTKIAGDLWAHRSYHMTDSRFDLNYYKNVIAAIESIPGDFDSDEFSLTQYVNQKKFFNKNDMKWFRKSVKVENFDLYLRAIFRDAVLPDDPQTGIGLLEALSLFTRQIIRQGG